MITTIGIFTNIKNAENAVKELRIFGVEERNISCVFKSEKSEEKNNNMENISGLNMSIGKLQGYGVLLTSGPIATVLGFSGNELTITPDGLLGALTKIGIAGSDVALYEKHIPSGDVLLIAHRAQPSTQDIFLTHGALEVRQYQDK